jgi:hypothetical protein
MMDDGRGVLRVLDRGGGVDWVVEVDLMRGSVGVTVMSDRLSEVFGCAHSRSLSMALSGSCMCG